MGLESVGTPAMWVGFLGFVLVMLAVDLGIFHRRAHVVGFREALIWSGVWISLALLFNAGVWWAFGPERAVEFLTGYLVEKSLSIDNIFVFVVIFTTLGIPVLYQHRVLFWGIVTALALRAVMIVGGAAMLERFHWLMYVFGVFLIVTGIKLFVQRGQEEHPEKSLVMRAVTRLVPSTTRLDDHHFFTVVDGRWVATPLFMALVLVELTDVLFAVDSIPAIFAITRDPFLVFTSNIFAILGLRSLFFLLADLVDRFRYLKVGLAGVLVFVGGKMILGDVVEVPALVSLAVIAAMLGASILVSWVVSRREAMDEAHSS